MLLQQLKIKNLASLRGEHTIEFATLTGQDLFAITGETGAGKSTLLNALALALYGRLYKRQLIQSDLVTLGEREASIALQFSSKGTHYLATWSTVVRKKDGTPLGNPRTERFFYQLPAAGNIQEARVLDTDAEQVLQLDFEQFCKCVVLNQGEFARFLMASFAERRDILERLYPSDNIDSVGGLAKRKFEEKRLLANNLEVQAHALQEESLFDVDSVKQQQQRHQEEVLRLEIELAKVRPLGQVLDTLLSQFKLHSSASRALKESSLTLEERTQANNMAMTQYQAQHETTLKLTEGWDAERPAIEKHMQEAQELVLWRAEEKNLQLQLTEKQHQQKAWQERLSKLQAHALQLQHEIDELRPQLQLVPSDADWSSVDLKRGLELQRQSELHKPQLEQLSQQLRQIEEEGKAQKDKLALAELTMASELSKLPASWQTLTPAERQQQLKILRQQQAEKTLLIQQQEELHRETELLQAPLIAASELAQQSAWLASLIELRTQLVHNHPQGLESCPVCEQQMKPALWEKLTSQWDEKRSSTAQVEAKSAQQKLQELRTQQSAQNTQLKTIQARLQSFPESVALQPIEEAAQRLLQLHSTQVELQSSIDSIRLRWKGVQENLQRLQRQQDQQQTDQLAWLAQLNGALKSSHVWSIDLLSSLQKDFEVARTLQERLREEKTLAAQSQQLKTDVEQLAPLITQLHGQQKESESRILARHEILQKMYPGATPPEVFRQRSEELKTQQQLTQRLQNEYRHKERDLGEVRARVSAVTDQLKQIELLFTQERDKLSPLLKAPIALRIEEAEVLLTPMSQANETQQKDLSADLKFHTEKLAELKTLLEKDRQLHEKRKHLQDQQQKLSAEVSRYKRLMEVLGQDDLRSYVLSLVESALIRQTNSELLKLCGGRYEIQHSSRKGKLAPEFWVIDRWRDGLLRKVTTLSGGETFMVSLAMALALAEMTRGRADIDCFFIDEGFGTLDEDSLDGVLEMLQQVQSRGKQIGLITHVKTLSARLPLNLHLHKDPRGNSTVKLVWN